MNLSKLKKALHLEVISSRKSSTSADQSHSNRKSSLKASSNRRNTIESLLSSDLEEKNFKSFVYVKKSVGVSGIRIWKKRILILEKSERILKIYKPAPNQELNSRSTFAMRQLKNNLEGKDDIESVYSDELLESTIDLRNEIHVDLMSKKKEGRRFDLVIYSIVKNVSEDVKITSTHTENVNDNEKNTNAITYSFLCAEEKAAKWWVIQISSLISPQENQLSSPQAVRLKYIFHNVENDNDSGPSLTPIIPRRHPRPSLRMSSSGSLKQMIQRSSTSVSPTKSQKEVTKFSRRSLLGSKYAQLMRKALNEMTPFHRTIWKFLNTIRMLYNSQYRAKKFFLKQKELEVGSRRFSKSTTMNLEMSFLDSDDVVGIKDSKSNTNALEFEAENLALSDSDSEDDSIKPLTDEFDISCSLSTMPKFLKLSGIEPKLIYSLMVVELRKTARCFYDDYPANSATVKSKVQSKDYPFLLCFTGKEFHDWIVRDCHQSENEAFEVGSHLLQHQIFQRVQDIDKFDKSTEYSSSEDVFYVILEYPESDQRQILENIDTSDNLYDFKSLRYQSLDVFQQMEIWVHQMRSPNGGVPLETNKKGLKYNYSSFTGRVALEWLVFGMKAIHGLTTATAFLSELLYRGSIINAFDTNCKVFRSRDVYFFNNESKDFSSTLHLFSECSSKSFRKFVLSLSSDSQVIYLMLRHLNNEKNGKMLFY